jgi:hypothetical protein
MPSGAAHVQFSVNPYSLMEAGEFGNAMVDVANNQGLRNAVFPDNTGDAAGFLVEPAVDRLPPPIAGANAWPVRSGS